MPSQQIKMNIHALNNGPTSQMYAYALQQHHLQQQQKTTSHLYSPMISRIHKTKPGCSSCGK